MKDAWPFPDLAAHRLGGEVLEANDEFFAPKENLLKPGPPSFDPEAYTDRGKEMDGWETRRRRTPGNDWCVIRLGVPGIVRTVVVDTSFFRGNYPESFSLEGAAADDELASASWTELVPSTALEGDSVNRVDVDSPLRVTHVRLNIHPDGGVARLRVLGEPLPDLRAVVGADGAIDVAASTAGGVVLDASDVFFSSPTNLLAPDDPGGMHDGWETKRRRGPGHDWALVRLAAESDIDRVEVDTSFFKGNYPDAFSLDVRLGADDAEWREAVASTKLGPDERAAFPIDPPVRATHVRLNVFPDGGIARLRLFGRVTEGGWRAFGVRWLSALSPDAFEREILPCCGSTAWARAMREARPFADFPSLLEASDAAWRGLSREDRLEAFAAHPRIGDRGGSAWSRGEQSGATSAGEDVLAELEAGNRAYEDRFGHVFLIDATGKTAREMLGTLRDRLGHEPEAELDEAAEQQRLITRRRLEKLVRPASG